MRRVQQVIEDGALWAVRSTRNLIVSSVIILTVFLLGVSLQTLVPGWIADASKTSTRQAIADITQEAIAARDRLYAERTWYVQSYTAGLEDKLVSVQTELNAAQTIITTATGSPEEVLIQIQGAATHLDAARQHVADVTTTLNDNAKLREEVRTQLTTLQTHLNGVREKSNTALNRFNAESPAYISTYTNPLNQSILGHTATLENANQHYLQAEALMPPDTTVDHIGDPNAARALLNQATTLAGEAQTGLDGDLTTLDTYLNKVRQADAALEAAERDVPNAQRHVQGIRDSRGFWLRASDPYLTEAATALQAARTASQTIVEGMIDRIAVFDQATRASAQSAEAIKSADGEVRDADETIRLLKEIDGRVSTATGRLNEANGARSVLSTYHAGDTWSDVDRLGESANLIAGVGAQKESALRYLDLSVQQFAAAVQDMRNAHDNVSTAERFANELIDRKNALEGYRSQWPGAEQNAANEIENNRANVNAYGSDDQSAVNDFNAAVNALNNARANASTGHYQTAVSQATSAQQAAAGTGDRAYSAYQARKRREEEARRQAEERARQAEAERQRQSQSGSSGGYSGGGGYSSGGDGYHSGGGSDGYHSGGGSDGFIP